MIPFGTKSLTLSMLIDLLTSTCRSTQVKIASTDLWPQEMFTFSEMLALIESESSFGAYVCHRRPVGSTATSDLVAGVNFVFSGFLNDPRREKRDSKWEELGAAKRTVAYRPVSSVGLLTGFSLPSIFSQSAERLHKQRRMASRKEQLFALFFIAWIAYLSHGKFFMGFRRAKSTQGNTNCQKNTFADDQVPDHQPQALMR